MIPVKSRKLKANSEDPVTPRTPTWGIQVRIIPCILRHDTREEWFNSRPGRYTSGETVLLLVGSKAGQAPKLVWTLPIIRISVSVTYVHQAESCAK